MRLWGTGMTTKTSRWSLIFLSRFSDREDLGREGAYASFWSDMPRESVFELFDLIEFEYRLSPGVLRPDDPMSKLCEPLKFRNPLTWGFLEARLEDANSELRYRLAKRSKRFGTLGSWSVIRTTDELVRAWCGLRGPEGADRSSG